MPVVTPSVTGSRGVSSNRKPSTNCDASVGSDKAADDADRRHHSGLSQHACQHCGTFGAERKANANVV